MEAAVIYAVSAIAAAVVGAVMVGRWARGGVRRPGSLEASGSFSSVVDLSDSRTREERERDFTRVCRAQLFLQFTQLDRGNATSLRLLDLERRETFDEYASQISERYFDAESFVLTEYAFALVSATTPFEFATQFNVAPNFSETRYVVVHDPERKALRILWAAFASDSPGAPPPQPPRRWPLFLCFISEPLLLRKNVGRFETRFTYCCERNHASSLGVAIDEWFRANATTLLRTP